MSDEKSKLLQMVRDGKISVEEGLELLSALEGAENGVSGVPYPEKKPGDRFLRVHVDSTEAKVNVNIPLSPTSPFQTPKPLLIVGALNLMPLPKLSSISLMCR